MQQTDYPMHKECFTLRVIYCWSLPDRGLSGIPGLKTASTIHLPETPRHSVWPHKQTRPISASTTVITARATHTFWPCHPSHAQNHMWHFRWWFLLGRLPSSICKVYSCMSTWLLECCEAGCLEWLLSLVNNDWAIRSCTFSLIVREDIKSREQRNLMSKERK